MYTKRFCTNSLKEALSMNSVVFRRKLIMTTRSGPYFGFESSLKFPGFLLTKTLVEMAECSVTNFGVGCFW